VNVAREYLTLRAFAERARSIAPERKDLLTRELRRVGELRRAAEVLWNGGAPAQGWRLLREAVEAAIGLAHECTQVDEGENEFAKAIGALGLPAARVTELVGVRRQMDQLATARLDAEVTPAHVQFFPKLRGCVATIEELAAPYGADEAEVRRQRRLRWIRTAIVSLACLVGLGLFIAAQFRTRVTASANFSTNHEAPNVLDGNSYSEWLLPNGSVGWLDVQLSPSRTVRRVRLINAHNVPHHDRATKEFRIEVYSGNELVKSVDASFPSFEADPKWTTFEFGETSKVTRVRLVVKSFFLAGGGFAEVRVD